VYPELSSLTTAVNAIFSRRIARELGITEVVVTTCAWHAPRAVACFERVGMVARPLRAEPPPSGPFVRARRMVHELVSTRLDRWHLDRVCARPGEPHPFGHAVGGRE
jgi:uncharacterized SAM-binding protein YcdF (DUF218 family)